LTSNEGRRFITFMFRMTWLIVWLLLVLPAQADETKALVYLKTGISLYETKDWEAARQAFLQAHNEAPDKANPYRWLGFVEVQRGNCAGAIGYFDEFLLRAKPDDERRAEVIEQTKKCRMELASQSLGRTTRPQPPAKAASPQNISKTGIDGMIIGTATGARQPLHMEARHRRWWVWTAVGGAIAVGIGVGLGVGLGTHFANRPPSTMGGNFNPPF
jgi:tetratricopeptide (TPR) repeat protein